VTWVKLDDRFPTHPKMMGLTDRAFRAHVIGICYAAAHLTDGMVPPGIVPPRSSRELVAAGVWLVCPEGFLIHDYLDYNPSREQVREERRRAAERTAKSRRSSGVTSPELRRESHDPTPPHPTPNTAEGKGALSAVPDNRPDADQVYLAERIAETWDKPLGIPALQKLNNAYGRVSVTDALRELHGFPPDEAVRSPFAYLESICTNRESA
jgi:hypothetical protein